MQGLDKELECHPLFSVEELLQWEKYHKTNSNVASIKISDNLKLKSSKRTLVCHDMKGGYLEDRFPYGVATRDGYRFFHWPYVDIFVYFSHYFVTIPPISWINAAHKNDVFILGTFITEWDDGKIICDAVLESREKFHRVVDKMVAITQHYGFDGWLINIENQIQEEKISMLRDFVKYLTTELHNVNPNGLVIWYDSVIKSGELKWQDQLNDKNKLFYDVCDGIFLNYTWTDEKLQQSSMLTQQCNRPSDVYVGVDVFGRNCFGGGGFNTCKALDVIQKHNLSLALFAQGWVFEKADGDNVLFTDNEYKFWGLLQQYITCHGIQALPFYSSFCQGQGAMFCQNGKVISQTPWTNLSLQSVQPHLLDSLLNENTSPPSTMSKRVHFDDAYYGGGCLKLGATFRKKGDFCYSRLFSFNNLDIKSCNLGKEFFVSYVIKTDEDCVSSNSNIFLDLDLKQKSNGHLVRLRLSSGDEKSINGVQYLPGLDDRGERDISGQIVKSVMCIPCLNDLNSVSNVVAMPEGSGWEVRAYVFENLNDHILQAVNVGISSSCDDNSYPFHFSTLLGQLQISGTEQVSADCRIHNLEVVSASVEQNEDNSTEISFSCTLNWRVGEPSEQLECFQVYYKQVNKKIDQISNSSVSLVETTVAENKEWVMHGSVLLSKHSHKQTYRISNLEISIANVDSMAFKVKPVSYNGINTVILDKVPTTTYSISLN